VRGQGLVPSTTGFAVQARVGPAELARADTVVVPGYAPYDAPSPAVLAALRRATGRGARMVSVCTGAFALAAAGLLDGRRATTHWRDAAELAARHPAVHVDADVLFVDDGAVLTSAGVAAGIDLRLHLVRGDYGEQAASRIARRMVVAPYRDGGQAQFVQRPLPVNGTGLAATCAWARERLAEPVTVAALAAQRLLEARRLLEATRLPVVQVAARCGLGTTANLRLHLLRDAATTPTAYRRSYRGAGAQGVDAMPVAGRGAP